MNKALIYTFILPGLFIFARLSLAEYLVVLKEVSPMEALKESFNRTAPYTWEIIWSCTALMAFFWGIGIFVGAAVSTMPHGDVIFTIIQTIIHFLLFSFLTILLYRYFDLTDAAGMESTTGHRQ